MLSKNRIKYINSLKINKFRKQHSEFIIEGTKLISELLQSNFAYSGIYATKDWLAENERLLQDIVFELAEPKEMQQISNLTTPPGALAVVSIPKTDFVVSELKNQLCIVLDGINDPGNMGTIIRTADWFGISTIFCSQDCVDAFHPKVVQSTMGSIFRVKIIETDLVSLLDQTREFGMKVFGAFMDGENVFKAPLHENGLLVIGSESHGIRANLTSHLTDRISVPSFAKQADKQDPESLNASIAAAIILAEFRRRIC